MPKMQIDKVRHVIEQAKDLRKPFVVKFRTKKDNTIRTMTCLTHDPSGGEFVTGIEDLGKRAAEDKAKGLITVFSLDVFQELVAKGQKRDVAGHSSWRRIPISRCTRAVLL